MSVCLFLMYLPLWLLEFLIIFPLSKNKIIIIGVHVESNHILRQQLRNPKNNDRYSLYYMLLICCIIKKKQNKERKKHVHVEVCFGLS